MSGAIPIKQHVIEASKRSEDGESRNGGGGLVTCALGLGQIKNDFKSKLQRQLKKVGLFLNELTRILNMPSETSFQSLQDLLPSA
jgi:hypothetical protein